MIGRGEHSVNVGNDASRAMAQAARKRAGAFPTFPRRSLRRAGQHRGRGAAISKAVIDLDHNATTPLDPRVGAAMGALIRSGDADGNPSSVHGRGRVARSIVEAARRRIAAAVGVDALDLTFTSGGTESDNLAVFGTCRALRAAGRPCGLLTTRLEHPAVADAATRLRAEGFEVVWLGVDGRGAIDPDDLHRAVAEHDVGLVSIAAANHELGNRYDLRCLGDAARAGRPEVLLHSDAVQALGKVEVNVPAWGVDLLSITAHKLHGPKGIGALIHPAHLSIEPLLRGGGQERGRRPGTESPLLAHAFAEAVTLAEAELDERRAHASRLSQRLREGLVGLAIGATIHGEPEASGGNTVNVRFDGCDGELLLMNLDLEGIAVSTGAACSAGTLEPSPVLLALGLDPAVARGAVRISVGKDNTDAHVDRLLTVLPDIVGRVRAVGAA